MSYYEMGTIEYSICNMEDTGRLYGALMAYFDDNN